MKKTTKLISNQTTHSPEKLLCDEEKIMGWRISCLDKVKLCSSPAPQPQ